MTIEYVLANLQSHEARSQARYEELRDLINVKETAMTEPVSVKNIFETPNSGIASILPMMAGMGGGSTGAAMGGGLGAGTQTANPVNVRT